MKTQNILEPRFEIGELVYHPSTSTVGLVIGHMHMYHTKQITYRVLLPLDNPIYDENKVSWFDEQLQKIDDRTR